MRDRSIDKFKNKVIENGNGTITGGFGSIKGGLLPLADNAGKCDNSKTCSGSNSNDCTNSGDCSSATNPLHSTCNNTGTCFA